MAAEIGLRGPQDDTCSVLAGESQQSQNESVTVPLDARLPQLRVVRLGCFQDWVAGAGFFPDGEGTVTAAIRYGGADRRIAGRSEDGLGTGRT
jgi:hypothetical protein